MGKSEGKKSDRVAVHFGPKEQAAFKAPKEALLKVFTADRTTRQPVVLRVEASDRAALRKGLSPIVRDMERCLPKLENEDGPSLRQLIQLAVRRPEAAKGPSASM